MPARRADGRVKHSPDADRESDTPIAVVRVITRLNIGGPSIQATRLSALDRDGFSTTLIHGRLGDGEGDMSYLIAPGSRAIYVDTLCRPLSPLNDLRAWLRIYPRAAQGPAADRAYPHGQGRPDRTIGRRGLQRHPRQRAARQGDSHVSRPRARGIFQPADDARLHWLRATAGARQRCDRRDLARD